MPIGREHYAVVYYECVFQTALKHALCSLEPAKNQSICDEKAERVRQLALMAASDLISIIKENQ